MGALTDLCDRECFRMDQLARNAAEDFFDRFQDDKIIDNDDELRAIAAENAGRVSTYPPAQSDFVDYFITWIHRYLGTEPPQKFYVFYGFNFKDHPERIDQLKTAIRNLGLGQRERISTDNDFFMFHPVEHGPGLEIINQRHLPLKWINRAIIEVIKDNGQPLQFGY